MRRLLTSQHKDYFSQHHHILFERVLSEKEGLSLKEQLLRSTATSAYEGKDSLRAMPSLRAFAQKKEWASLLMEMLYINKMRYAGDWWLKLAHSHHLTNSVQGFAGGILISFEEDENYPFGSFFFFDKEYLFNLEPLLGRAFLMLFYAREPALYIYNAEDPQNGYLRSLGYQFGDRLNTPDFPLFTSV